MVISRSDVRCVRIRQPQFPHSASGSIFEFLLWDGRRAPYVFETCRKQAAVFREALRTYGWEICRADDVGQTRFEVEKPGAVIVGLSAAGAFLVFAGFVQPWHVLINVPGVLGVLSFPAGGLPRWRATPRKAEVVSRFVLQWGLAVSVAWVVSRAFRPGASQWDRSVVASSSLFVRMDCGVLRAGA
jgi:hypothetical protein